MLSGSDTESVSYTHLDVYKRQVMRNAEVNNLDDMTGYGLTKLWDAIPALKVVDLCYNVLFSDLDKAEKIILINELLCEFDSDGKPKQMCIRDRAEAVEYFKKAEPLYIDQRLEQMAVEAQEEHRESDPREGVILNFLDTLVPED